MANKIDINTKTLFKVLVFLAGAWVIWQVKSIVGLLLASYIIFAGLNPIVENLYERKYFGKKIPRAVAILSVFAVFLILVSLAIWAIIGPTYDEFLALAGDFDSLISDIVTRYNLDDRLGNDRLLEIKNTIVTETQAISTRIVESPDEVVNFGLDIFGALLSFVTLMAIVFYQLSEPNKIKNFVINFFNNKEKASNIMDQVEDKLGYWLQGQLTLMIMMSFLSYIVFSLIGIPFAFPLALIVGLFDIVAIIGPIIAFIPIIIVSLALAEPWQTLSVSIFYLLLQQVEGNILVPKIMQSSVGLDPVVVILALMIGSSLFGIAGAILSVPVAAVLMILYEQWQKDRKKAI